MYKTPKNSITKKIPWLIDEWDFKKNGDLSPENVAWRSNKKIWWLCDEGHSWNAAIISRKNCGCPYCSGNAVLQGFNDLATTNPELTKQWDYKKNILKPTEITSGSNKKAWWLCDKGHSWNAVINSRKNYGCPYCSGNAVLQGFNDLATTNPELTKQWDYKKNILKPTEITSGSEKKAWWLCDKGHSWNAVIYNRKNKGCPYCSGKAILQGFNDLATLNPRLASEWHPTKNKGVTPNSIFLNSRKKYWWLCNRRHAWEISPKARNNGSGCPYCSGRFAVTGETDLATLNPKLAGEWHPTKNKNETPENVTFKSHKKIWWICENNHEWKAPIQSRTAGSGCPYCSGRKPIVGETDLETVMPEIAAEWHPTKNKKTPEDVTFKSHKKVWWICENNHEWKAFIYSRTEGSGCPYCSGKKLIVVETD